MNIPYDATLIWAVIDGEVAATHLSDIKDQLVLAGWTATNVAATQTGTFTGAAGNNQTVTIDGTVYTFKTTLTGAAYEVLIGANAAASANNLARAINDSGTAGTNYGTGTAAHPTVTATDNGAGVITITAQTSGTGGNGLVLAETVGNFSWAAAATAGGGFRLVSSDAHPCKYRAVLYISQTSAGAVQYRAGTEYETNSDSSRAWLAVGTGRAFSIRATPYDVWIIRTDSSAQDFFYFGALWNPSEWGPATVTTIGAGATTTLTVTGHGFTTGQVVTLSQFSGDANWLAVNGRSFTITVVDANNFTIPLNSSGFATGTPGYAGNEKTINLSLIACGSLGQASTGGHFRNGLSHSGNGTVNLAGAAWTAFNNSSASMVSSNANANGNVRMMGIGVGSQATTGMFIGLTGYAMFEPAMISHGITSLTATSAYYVGVMWNAVAWLGTAIVENNLTPIALDGRTFYNITDRTGATAFYMCGCIFIEVP